MPERITPPTPSPVEARGLPPEPLEAVLEVHPFTRGLSAAHLRVMARAAKVRNVAAGHYLWRQGDRNVETYLVVEGEIAFEITVPDEDKLWFETVRAGEIAGCTGLFHSDRWGFDGRVATAVRVVALDSRSLRSAIECDHELGYQLLERCTNSLGERLNENRFKLVEAHRAALV